MKFYTSMPKKLKHYYQLELDKYWIEYHNGQLQRAWKYLERAHILGQRYPGTHSFVHWEMLKFGFKTKRTKEVLGQIPRLLFGGVKSFVGIVPVGNPGGANVPPLRPFPIDEELQEIFVKSGLLI
jgi:hypothetical protein